MLHKRIRSFTCTLLADLKKKEGGLGFILFLITSVEEEENKSRRKRRVDKKLKTKNSLAQPHTWNKEELDA